MIIIIEAFLYGSYRRLYDDNDDDDDDDGR